MKLAFVLVLCFALPVAAADGVGGGFGSVVNSVVSTGSTTARTFADRFAQVANVKDFGAKCDGSTDDSGAFQSALNSDGSGPGQSDACTVTKAAVAAGTTLTWSIGTACGTNNPAVNLNAHMTTP